MQRVEQTAMAAILNFVIISCFAVATNAAKLVGTEAWRLNDQLVLNAAPAEKDGVAVAPKKDVNWTSWDHFTAYGAGAAVGGAVAGAIVFFLLSRTSAEPKEVEEESGEECKDVEAAAEEEAAPVEEAEPESKSADTQKLLQIMAQKVAQEVGPKIQKGGAIRNVLEARMMKFQDKAKNLVMNEMNSTAGEVLKELDAPESMLLLDWNAAVEANFPPASVLLAGALTPACMKLMSFHHLLQMVTVGLPMTILCVAAIIVDWSAPCPSIPTIFGWLYTQTILAACLFFGHLFLLLKIIGGKNKLAARAQEIQEQQEESVSGMRDQFVSQTILLQEALIIEQDIRACIWNKIVGVATSAWLITTIWNLILIAGWTFVPGVVAFHPAAAKEAPEAYCGTWMTVLVLRINLLLAVLYLFFNLATIVQFFCDLMIESQGFQSAVLSQARKMDGAGLPVVELLVKALLLRGGSDTLDAQVAVIQNQKKELEKQIAELENKQASVGAELEKAIAAEETLKAKIEADGGGSLSARASGSISYDTWRQRGDQCIEEAEAKAKDVEEATTKALETLYEKINSAVDAAQNSEAAQMMKAKAAEAEAAARKGAADAQAAAQQGMDKLNDPEFQKQLQEQAQKGMDAAQSTADQAKAAASDPELQKKLAEAAQKATEQGKKAADQAKQAADQAQQARHGAAKKFGQ